MTYQVHSIESAPEAARDALAGGLKRYGFVPNLWAVMAESPALLKGYIALQTLFDETSLTPIERQVVQLAVSRFNACAYCMAAHSMIAGMFGAPDDVVQALRADRPLADPKLQVLRKLTVEIVETHGWPSPVTIEAFLGAGYTRAQVFEVVLGVGMKTLSNYTNHLADTPTDAAFEAHTWEKPAT